MNEDRFDAIDQTLRQLVAGQAPSTHIAAIASSCRVVVFDPDLCAGSAPSSPALMEQRIARYLEGNVAKSTEDLPAECDEADGTLCISEQTWDDGGP
jgi:hypothetical protein